MNEVDSARQDSVNLCEFDPRRQGALRKERSPNLLSSVTVRWYIAHNSRKILLWLEIPLLSQTIAELLPGIIGNRNHRTAQFLSFMCGSDV